MMEKTYVQHVAENIRDTLRKIKVIGGYELTIYASELALTDHNERKHLAAVVAVGEVEELIATHSHRVFTQTYYVVVTVVEPEATGTIEYQMLHENIKADVYKALMVDTNRGGYANQTQVGEATVDDEALQIAVICDIEHNHGDPYTRS